MVTKDEWACRANTYDWLRRTRQRIVGAWCQDAGVSLVRYRFRAYPTGAQVQMLARTFGCARVVYNDCLRVRQDAHAAGEKVSDTEVQRRVVTLAKQTPEREWLGEVASVALVQACQDARRAYRNWFDSLSGKRKGRKLGAPRFRSRKDNRQSVRLTRNGFVVRPNGRVYVAKVGDLRVEWSRPLPSVPSSCTVIREADGRYYVSFVVDRAEQPFGPRQPSGPSGEPVRRRSGADETGPQRAGHGLVHAGSVDRGEGRPSRPDRRQGRAWVPVVATVLELWAPRRA